MGVRGGMGSVVCIIETDADNMTMKSLMNRTKETGIWEYLRVPMSHSVTARVGVC